VFDPWPLNAVALLGQEHSLQPPLQKVLIRRGPAASRR